MVSGGGDSSGHPVSKPYTPRLPPRAAVAGRVGSGSRLEVGLQTQERGGRRWQWAPTAVPGPGRAPRPARAEAVSTLGVALQREVGMHATVVIDHVAVRLLTNVAPLRLNRLRVGRVEKVVDLNLFPSL